MTESQSVNDLQRENELLRKENESLKKRLNAQINSQRKYLETNRAKINERNKQYMKNVDPEKRKKWNRDAYLRRKERIKQQSGNKNNE